MKMLPRLQAEESLIAIDVALLSAGGFEQADARAMLDRLRTQATGQSARRAQRAMPQQLGGMGIGVKFAPPPGAVSAEVAADG